MSKSIKISIRFLFLLILLITHAFPIKADVDGDSPTSVMTAVSDNSITFEVKVPIDDIVVETIQKEDQAFSYLHLSGFSTTSQAGTPQLPFLTEVLGVPFDSEINVSVIGGTTTRQSLSAPLLPVTSESVEWDPDRLAAGSWDKPVVTTSIELNQEIYNSNAIFPGVLGKVSNDAVLRSQRLVSVALYPIQYDPGADEIILYDRLVVTVEFSGDARETQALVEDEPLVFENFFQDTLLNYEQAKTWRGNVPGKSLNGFTTAETAWLPSDPSWRIKVRETGFYKLTFPELIAAGVPIGSFDIDTLKMFHLGEEIAIKEIPGEAVVFYGESIDSKYTADNVYWLTYGGGDGRRMTPVVGTPQEASIPTSFLYTQHFEEDLVYKNEVDGSDDLDRFMWGRIVRPDLTSWTTNFHLDNLVDSATSVSLTISLFGFLQARSVNPDHHAAISINDTLVAENVTWDGFDQHLVSVVFPASLLLSDTNTLTITAIPTEYSADYFWIDWLEFDYERNFRSKSGRLQFANQTPGAWKFVLTDFVIDEIDIYDVSTASIPQYIGNVEVSGESAPYTAVFTDQISSAKDYLALDQNSYLSVSAIEKDTPSDLFSESNGADYLMISHQDFLGAAEELQTQKITQGLRTELIDVQDIYDEFGYGIEEPEAIRAFISYAYNHWVEPKPAYVLLIGDGHFDPRDKLGYFRSSFIPPFLANCDPKLRETAADNRYVSIVGDDQLPDLMLGRLSVNTEFEAQSIINKIIAYESDPPEGDWKRQILAVSDELDTEDWINFPQLSENLLRDYFPSEPFEAEEVYWNWTHTVLAEAQSDIQNAFNEGKFLVNYIGHGAYSYWGKKVNLFGTIDMPLLEPQSKLPIILAMTCFDGYFIFPNPNTENYEALAEVITRTEGKGAVASWSPTGWGSYYGHDALNRGFFKAVYQDGASIISDAIYAGILNLWATGDNLDLLDTYLLFGDPAMRMSLSLTAVKDTYTVNEDEVLTVGAEEGVLNNDINPDDGALTARLVDDVSAGSLVLNSNGSFAYTPEQDYYGSDAFSYRIYDGTSYSNTVIVQLTINPVNDPPVAEDQIVLTRLNTPVEITLTAIDDEGGGSSYLSGVNNNSNLTFELLSYPEHGELPEDPDLPYLVYTPDLDFLGIDQFMFKVNDGVFESNIARVEIHVGSNSIFLPLITK